MSATQAIENFQRLMLVASAERRALHDREGALLGAMWSSVSCLRTHDVVAAEYSLRNVLINSSLGDSISESLRPFCQRTADALADVFSAIARIDPDGDDAEFAGTFFKEIEAVSEEINIMRNSHLAEVRRISGIADEILRMLDEGIGLIEEFACESLNVGSE